MITTRTSRSDEYPDLVCELTSVQDDLMSFRVHRPSAGAAAVRSSYAFTVTFEEMRAMRFPNNLLNEHLAKADHALR